jgi:hypothetical protein
MRNTLFFIMLLCTFVFACTSQNHGTQCNLDGRAFKIENYTNGKLEGTEILVFKNGKAENDSCKQWGFGDGTYTCDADYRFKYTLTSEKEGRMDWQGQVTGSTVTGSMVWIKSGQNDIAYTFKGEEAKN